MTGTRHGRSNAATSLFTPPVNWFVPVSLFQRSHPGGASSHHGSTKPYPTLAQPRGNSSSGTTTDHRRWHRAIYDYDIDIIFNKLSDFIECITPTFCDEK